MYIEHSARGYDPKSGGQVVRRARFLILVQRESVWESVRCDRTGCSDGRYTFGEYDRERGVTLIHTVKCGSCDGTGLRKRLVHHREIRAIVRKVALHQCGHFMMGSARAFGERIGISGAYGSDGLPVTVSDRVFEHAVPLPSDLHDAWNKGGGHNSAGSEAPAMQAWALANLATLEAR